MSTLCWVWIIISILCRFDKDALSQSCAWSHNYLDTTGSFLHLRFGSLVEFCALALLDSRHAIASSCEIVDEGEASQIEFLCDKGTI